MAIKKNERIVLRQDELLHRPHVESKSQKEK